VQFRIGPSEAVKVRWAGVSGRLPTNGRVENFFWAGVRYVNFMISMTSYSMQAVIILPMLLEPGHI
jgi:hypothetical protein